MKKNQLSVTVPGFYTIPLLSIIFSLMIFSSGCVTMTPEYKSLQNNIANAEKAIEKDDYDTAAKEYINAIVAAENIAPRELVSLKKKLAMTYIEWSRTLYWKGKTDKNPEAFNKAIYLCEKAQEAYPRYKTKCGVYIAKFKREMDAMKYRQETSPEKIMPGRKERERKVAVLYRQAETLRGAGEYMRSRDKFEEILIIDPFNIDAVRQIQKIMRAVAKAGEERQAADKEAKMAEITWKQVEPLASREEAMEVAQREIEAGEKLRENLEACIIQSIDFKDTPAEKAFRDLNTNIESAMNIKFKFEFQGVNTADLAPITFKVGNIPADDAIEAICSGLKLFPTYSENSVIIQKKP